MHVWQCSLSHSLRPRSFSLGQRGRLSREAGATIYRRPRRLSGWNIWAACSTTTSSPISTWHAWADLSFAWHVQFHVRRGRLEQLNIYGVLHLATWAGLKNCCRRPCLLECPTCSDATQNPRCDSATVSTPKYLCYCWSCTDTVILYECMHGRSIGTKICTYRRQLA
jgi:hypothetical protein